MKILKWVGIILGTLVLLAILITTVTYIITERQRNETYQIKAETLQISNDPEVIEYGKHVATIRGCRECHGRNLGGGVFLDDPAMGLFIAKNLTTGKGGIGGEYSDEDFIKAIRHGVNKQNKTVIFMPAQEYNSIDSHDLAALISYIRTLEPVDNELPETKIGVLARFLYLFDGLDLFPARLIDHDKPIPEPIESRPPLEMGEYLAVTCTGCHGKGFSGGKIPGVPPDWPEAANLTPAGNPGHWTVEEFKQTLRTGITPEGKELKQDYMPWPVLGQMTDEELEGLFTYLQSLPERKTGTR